MSRRAEDRSRGEVPYLNTLMPREVLGLLAGALLLLSCTVTTRQPPQDRRSTCDPVAVRVDNQAFEDAVLYLDGRRIIDATGKMVTTETVCRFRFRDNQRNWTVNFVGVRRPLRLRSQMAFGYHTRGVFVRLPIRAWARIPEASEVRLLRPEE